MLLKMWQVIAELRGSPDAARQIRAGLVYWAESVGAGFSRRFDDFSFWSNVSLIALAFPVVIAFRAYRPRVKPQKRQLLLLFSLIAVQTITYLVSISHPDDPGTFFFESSNQEAKRIQFVEGMIDLLAIVASQSVIVCCLYGLKEAVRLERTKRLKVTVLFGFSVILFILTWACFAKLFPERVAHLVGSDSTKILAPREHAANWNLVTGRLILQMWSLGLFVIVFAITTFTRFAEEITDATIGFLFQHNRNKE